MSGKNQTIKDLVLGLLTGALIGYIVGWLTGWSIIDPNSDLWALGAAGGAIGGLPLGMTPFFRARIGSFFGGTLGFYLGWVLRTLIFGDVPGGPGLLVMAGGTVMGAYLGTRRPLQQIPLNLAAGILYGAFFGGLIFGGVLQWVPVKSNLGMAPSILISGLLCWLLITRWGRRETSKGKNELEEQA